MVQSMNLGSVPSTRVRWLTTVWSSSSKGWSKALFWHLKALHAQYTEIHAGKNIHTCKIKMETSSEVTQQVKVLATKRDSLSLIPGILMRGENQLSNCPLDFHMCTYTNEYSIKKTFKEFVEIQSEPLKLLNKLSKPH